MHPEEENPKSDDGELTQTGEADSSRLPRASRRGSTSIPWRKRTRTPRIRFGQAVSLAFANMLTFRGRATRSEYWFFALFSRIVAFAAMVFDRYWLFGESLGPGDEVGLGPDEIGLTEALTMMVMTLPILSVFCRRLHDTGHTGKWLAPWLVLLSLLYATDSIIAFCAFLILSVQLFAWLCTDGDRKENRYGPPRRRLESGRLESVGRKARSHEGHPSA